MKDSVINKSNLERQKNLSKDSMQNLYLERLKQFFELAENSNEWKKKYEYYQQSKQITGKSIIVSET